MNRKKIVSIVFLVLSVVWMGVIFFLSSQDGEASSATSGRIASKVFNMLYGSASFSTETAKIETYNNVSYMVRKLGHITEYFILTTFLYLGTIFLIDKKLIPPLFSIISAFIYALTDEFHQSFVGGRGPSFYDVLIDSIGISISISLIILIIFICQNTTNRRS